MNTPKNLNTERKIEQKRAFKEMQLSDNLGYGDLNYGQSISLKCTTQVPDTPQIVSREHKHIIDVNLNVFEINSAREIIENIRNLNVFRRHIFYDMFPVVNIALLGSEGFLSWPFGPQDLLYQWRENNYILVSEILIVFDHLVEQNITPSSYMSFIAILHDIVYKTTYRNHTLLYNSYAIEGCVKLLLSVNFEIKYFMKMTSHVFVCRDKVITADVIIQACKLYMENCTNIQTRSNVSRLIGYINLVPYKLESTFSDILGCSKIVDVANVCDLESVTSLALLYSRLRLCTHYLDFAKEISLYYIGLVHGDRMGINIQNFAVEYLLKLPSLLSSIVDIIISQCKALFAENSTEEIFSSLGLGTSINAPSSAMDMLWEIMIAGGCVPFAYLFGISKGASIAEVVQDVKSYLAPLLSAKTLLEKIIYFFKFMLERGYMFFITGEIRYLYKSDLELDFYENCVELLAKVDNVQGSTSDDPTCNPYDSIISELDVEINLANKLLKTPGSRTDRLLSFKDRLVKAKQIMIYNSTHGKMRQAPYGILLIGPPSVGKSFLTNMIIPQVMSTYGLAVDHNVNIYTTNSNDEFFSGYVPAKHSVIVMDDIAQKSVEAKDFNELMLAISLINNIPFNTVQAELEKKGNIYATPKLVVATTNSKNVNTSMLNCPMAFLRRFLVIDVSVKDEYRVENASNVDTSKIVGISNYHSLEWRRCIVSESRHVAMQWNILGKGDIHDLADFLKLDVKRHMLSQQQFLLTMGKFYSKSSCIKCERIQSLCQCEIPILHPLNEYKETVVGQKLQPLNYWDLFLQTPSVIFETCKVKLNQYSNYKPFELLAKDVKLTYHKRTQYKLEALWDQEAESEFTQTLRYALAFMLCALYYKAESYTTVVLYFTLFVISGLIVNLSYRLFLWLKLYIIVQLEIVKIKLDKVTYPILYCKNLALSTRNYLYIDMITRMASMTDHQVKQLKLIALFASSGAIITYVFQDKLRLLLAPAKQSMIIEEPKAFALNIPKSTHVNVKLEMDHAIPPGIVSICNKASLTGHTRLERNLCVIQIKSFQEKPVLVRAIALTPSILLLPLHAFKDVPSKGKVYVFFSSSGVSTGRQELPYDMENRKIFHPFRDEIDLVLLNGYLGAVDNILDMFNDKFNQIAIKGHLLTRVTDGYFNTQSLAVHFSHVAKFGLHMTLAFYSFSDKLDRDLAGYCGSPYVGSDDKIYGIHVTTVNKTLNAAPYAFLIITQTMIMQEIAAFPRLIVVDSKLGVLPLLEKHALSPLHSKSCLQHIKNGNSLVVGSLQNFHRIDADDIVQELPIARWLPDDYKCPLMQPIMKGVTELGDDNYYQYKHPYLIAYSASDSLFVEDIDLKRYEFVSTVMANRYKALLDKEDLTVHLLQPLSDTMNICGSLGEYKYIDSLNLQTSTGYPWNCKKVKMFTDRQIPIPISMEMDKIQDCWRNNTRYNPIIGSCMKLEPVSPNKRRDGRTRVFNVVPVAFTLLVRRNYLPILAIIQTYRHIFECAVGINVASNDWCEVIKFLQQMNPSLDKLSDSDFAYYDMLQPSYVMYSVLNLFIWIAKYIKNRYAMHPTMKYTDVNINQMEMIRDELMCPFISVNGDIIALSNRLISGISYTVNYNSLLNSWLNRYAWYAYYTDEFEKYVRLITYGDDGLRAIGNKEFTIAMMRDALKPLGIQITSAAKSGDLLAYQKLSEVTFLKRRWVWSDRYNTYLCPIEKSSLAKTLTYYLPSAALTLEQMTTTHCDAVLSNVFFNGEEEFYKVSDMLVQVCGKCAIEFKPKNYLYYENMYKNDGYMWKEGFQM